MKKIFKDKQLIIILALCIFSVILYLKTNDDPLIDVLRGTLIESWFYKFETGNSLLKDLSIGILVSTIFWLFNVYLPEKKKIKEKVGRLNRALFLILESFESGMSHHDKHYIHCRELDPTDINAIWRIKNSLDSNTIYGSLEEKNFYDICGESYDLFRFLGIAANEISPMHGALWDSITRNITVIGKSRDKWLDDRVKDGIKDDVDYSGGVLWLNLTEILESMEKWMELNK